jgi:hypothetical protein
VKEGAFVLGTRHGLVANAPANFATLPSHLGREYEVLRLSLLKIESEEQTRADFVVKYWLRSIKSCLVFAMGIIEPGERGLDEGVCFGSPLTRQDVCLNCSRLRITTNQ